MPLLALVHIFATVRFKTRQYGTKWNMGPRDEETPAPDPIVGRLNPEITRLLNSAEVKQRLLSAGTEPVGSSPQQLASTMKAEMARMSRVIKDAGIRAE